MSPVDGFTVPKKATGTRSPICSKAGYTGCDHQDRAGDQQTAKIVARRNQSNAEGQDSGTEQSRRGNQSDLRGIEPDPGQIDRKHDGGKAIAKAA
jgi:hypothetical protein